MTQIDPKQIKSNSASVGDVLTKGAGGVIWQAPSGGAGLTLGSFNGTDPFPNMAVYNSTTGNIDYYDYLTALGPAQTGLPTYVLGQMTDADQRGWYELPPYGSVDPNSISLYPNLPVVNYEIYLLSAIGMGDGTLTPDPAWIASSTWMRRDIYDTDNDGIVDNAEKLGGQLPSYYATSTHNHNGLYSALGHTHSEYSLTTHNHDSLYSALGHNHDSSYPAETTTTIGSLINSATAKTTPVDADQVGLMDSAESNVLKKLSWANIKATLKTYFDSLYALSSHNHSGVYEPADSTIIKEADVQNSIVVSTGKLELSGDSASPGASKYYGTNASSVKGYYDLPASGISLSQVYPVGCIYTEITGVNPNTTFGFGTWVAFGAGRCLVGVDTGQTEFNTIEKTGGAKTQAVNGVAQITIFGASAVTPTMNRVSAPSGNWTATHRNSATGTSSTIAESTGANLDASVSVLQPYITVYFWKRTA